VRCLDLPPSYFSTTEKKDSEKKDDKKDK
jgi:hypothetical protein